MRPSMTTPARRTQPLFTKKFFSTTAFGPGHIVGTGILALGLVGLVRLFTAGVDSSGGVGRGQYGKVP